MMEEKHISVKKLGKHQLFLGLFVTMWHRGAAVNHQERDKCENFNHTVSEMVSGL